MIIGYGRVSTTDQNLNLQLDALSKAGCERIFSEKFTGKTKDRPELNKLMEHLRAGDVLIVWRLDRLGRSTTDLIELVNTFEKKGVIFKSLTENIDTASATGRLFFTFFAAMAEFERNLIRERTNAGLQSARARGRVGGRKPGLSQDAQIKAAAAKTLYESGNTGTQICKMLGIGSKRTLYSYLRAKGVRVGLATEA
ncbi:recombinase family protein [Spirosoma sp.]|uniref:recombinase family protein n=1 Tax=Spirosoma sp. TaxID=1899569 RepID=UPI002626FD33|nr:recombinase family protein [Spirosoma sp.]MCX6216513.1 recombinase family protein [Spirosoma sp.]